MRAVWDSGLKTETEAEQAAFVASAAGIGFDTLIARDVGESFRTIANDAGLKVVQILTPYVDEAFASAYPDCLQRMTDTENAFGEVVAAHRWREQTDSAFRWFPHVNVGRWLCLRHTRSRDIMRSRIESALASADGIALDGVGYLNHYGCFCEVCSDLRTESVVTGERELERLARTSEDHLVEVSEFVTHHAKSVDVGCVVTNHLWPPFRPNEYYGYRLKMDFCCQTISWYHRPAWSLSRSRFEAEEQKRLEVPERNTFVPFVAVYHHPESVRPPDQIREEVRIGMEASGGHLCFSTLQTLQEHPDSARAVGETMMEDYSESS